MTSNHSGITIENIGNLGQILQNILIKYSNFQNVYQNNDSLTQISVSILSIGKICNSQKIEPNSKIYAVNFCRELPYTILYIKANEESNKSTILF